MEDISNYSLDAIYEMIKDGSITVEELAEYITEVVAEMAPSEDLKEFLVAASEYMDRRIKSGYEEIQEMNEQEPKEAVSDGEDGTDQSTTQATTEEEKASETERPEPIFAPVVEEAEEMQPVEEEVVNEPEELPVNEIEQPEPVPAYEGVYFDSDGNPLNDAEREMRETKDYCERMGMTVEDISLMGKGGHGPYITFEINNESRQMLNHLMNEFYQNNDGIAIEFMRDLSTKSEFFTIEIAAANMSQEQFYTYVKETFERIYQTIETTRKDFEYENAMPDGLRQLKERFRNDDPDIGQDFTVGYINDNGKDSFYLVADDSEKAYEYARSIGYDIKARPGANIYEIDAESTVGTKLEGAAVALETEEAVYDIEQNGVADLDIYPNLEQDPRVELIQNFIETSNDPHLMCMLEVEIPPENTSQRVVTMKTEMGGSDTVVFTDGDEFDNKVMPQVIDTYIENNPIEKENIYTSAPDPMDRASMQVESENNTTLVVNGYTESDVNRMVEDIETKTEQYQSGMEQEKSNVRQKTIGTYPTNNNQNTSNAFVSMPVLFVICILFVLMISLIIFAM